MKVTLQLATSIDGFIARRDGSFDWCFTDQDYGMAEFAHSVDAVIMGRRSYELMLEMGELPYPDKPYYVLTHATLRADSPNVTTFAGDAESLRMKMVNEGVKHAWLFGGSNVCGQFAQRGLIDDVMIAVHPIALGQGIPLFRDLVHDVKLKLKDSRNYDTGLVMLHYQVVRTPRKA
ncbi:MAG TPA: dihydrofolate reductase family protein [Nevskiaceae bacterium]|nr:dihydrofolate reductase family protein [Nevskiaceae bacterium]